MLNLLKLFDARMGEPSTYASIAVLLGLLNVNVDPGVMHTVATGSSGHLGLYRLETQVTAGPGALVGVLMPRCRRRALGGLWTQLAELPLAALPLQRLGPHRGSLRRYAAG